MPKEGGIFYYSQSQDFNPMPALAALCKICYSISCNKWLRFAPTSTTPRHLQRRFSGTPVFFPPVPHPPPYIQTFFCCFWAAVGRVKLAWGISVFFLGGLGLHRDAEAFWSTCSAIARHASLSRESSLELRTKTICVPDGHSTCCSIQCECES